MCGLLLSNNSSVVSGGTTSPPTHTVMKGLVMDIVAVDKSTDCPMFIHSNGCVTPASDVALEIYEEFVNYDYMAHARQHLVIRHYHLGKDIPKNENEMQRIRDIIDYLEAI